MRREVECSSNHKYFLSLFKCKLLIFGTLNSESDRWIVRGCNIHHVTIWYLQPSPAFIKESSKYPVRYTVITNKCHWSIPLKSFVIYWYVVKRPEEMDNGGNGGMKPKMPNLFRQRSWLLHDIRQGVHELFWRSRRLSSLFVPHLYFIRLRVLLPGFNFDLLDGTWVCEVERMCSEGQPCFSKMTSTPKLTRNELLGKFH